MKFRVLFITSVLVHLGLLGFAQNNINWIRHIGSLYTDRAQHLVNDNNGNLFICGQFSDMVEVQAQSFSSMGMLDGLLMKTDTLGNLLWITQWKGPKDVQFNRIQYLSSTQLIVTGTFSDSLLYENETVYALGFDDAFIASVNPTDGTLNWINTAGSYYGYEFIGGLSVANHRIFWAVNYSSTLYIGNESFTCDGAYDFMLCELDTTGQVMNPKAYHGSGIDLVSAIAADANGNIFVCGKFNDELTAESYTVNTNGMFDLFYMAQAEDGNVSWLRSAGGYSTEVANAIAIGQNQDIYMGCWMQDTLFFEDSLMVPDPSGEIFVVKLDYEGNKVWLFRGFPDSGADQITDITINCKGDILFTGLTTYFANLTPDIHTQAGNERNERCAFGDTYIAKLNTAGELVWLKNTLGTNSNLGMGISADKYGKIYVCGYFTDSLYAGIHKINGNGGNDIMFFMLNDNEKCFSQPVSFSQTDETYIYLYPNPSDKQALLVVKNIGPCTINVLTIDGRILNSKYYPQHGNVIPLQDILLEEINEGVYLIQIQSEERLQVLRWVYLR